MTLYVLFKFDIVQSSNLWEIGAFFVPGKLGRKMCWISQLVQRSAASLDWATQISFQVGPIGILAIGGHLTRDLDL